MIGRIKRTLGELSELGDCTNPSAESANKTAVCDRLTKLLDREEKISWRKFDYFKVIGPTLALISGSIRCGEEEDLSGVDKSELTKLADMIDAKLLKGTSLSTPIFLSIKYVSQLLNF